MYSLLILFFHLGDRTFKWEYACLQRLRAHPANCSLFCLFFIWETEHLNSIIHASKDYVHTQLSCSFFILSFFHLGDITFEWNYAFLIVLEDVHIPVSMATFFQDLLSIIEDSYPDWVVTIKSVSFIWVSFSALYLLMFKTLRFTNLYYVHEISISMLVMKTLVSIKFYNFDQASL